MPEDLPAHPSLIGELEDMLPWNEVLDPEILSGENDVSVSHPEVTFLPHRNSIEYISHVLMKKNAILCGDATRMLRKFPDDHFACCITSPPYWQSMFSGKHEMLGAEYDPDEYVRNLVHVFREVRRTLKPSGTLWLVIGDAYASDDPEWWEMYRKNAKVGSINNRALTNAFKPNDMMGMPWRVALELQNDGWYLRSDIIWSIPNFPLEPMRDRPARIHNYIFLLAKSEHHQYNIRSMDKLSKKTVWEIRTELNSPIRYTVFPEELVERCMRAGSKEDEVVLDPFFGSGTVGIVAKRLERRYVGIEIDSKTASIAAKRIRETG